MSEYLISARRVKGDSFDNEPGPVRFLKIPSNAKTPKPKHQMAGTGGIHRWFDEVRELADSRINQYSISACGDVLLFVHGYNVSPEDALTRQRSLQKRLELEEWSGLVVGFDWPSANSVLNYLEDRLDGTKVAQELVRKGIKPLMKGRAEGCKTNVHVLAHSAGAYVVMEAFAQAEKDGDMYKDDWRIGQVAFIGADVSSRSLGKSSDWSKPMFYRVMRLTNYQNPFDSVLGVSNAKRLGTAPRAGRVGLPDDANSKSVNVNCGVFFETLKPQPEDKGSNFAHSWYTNNRVFCRDFAMTMEGAIDRYAISTRLFDGNQLFLRDKPRPEFMSGWGIDDLR